MSVVALQCNETGMYLPDDYEKEWGRKYGIGRGPKPLTPVMDTLEDQQPTIGVVDGEEVYMFPIGFRMTTDMGFTRVTLPDQATFDANAAVTDLEDPKMIKRIKIVRSKQLEKPYLKSKIDFSSPQPSVTSP